MVPSLLYARCVPLDTRVTYPVRMPRPSGSSTNRVSLDLKLPWNRFIFGTQAFITIAIGGIGIASLVSGLADLGPPGQIPRWQRVLIGIVFVGLCAQFIGLFAAPTFRAARRRGGFLELRQDDLLLVEPGLLEAPFRIPRDAVAGITTHAGRVADRGLYFVRAPADISISGMYYSTANAKVQLSRAVPVPPATSRFLNRAMVAGEDLGITLLFLQLENPDDVVRLREWHEQIGAAG